jgi:hypothetical protein
MFRRFISSADVVFLAERLSGFISGGRCGDVAAIAVLGPPTSGGFCPTTQQQE